MEVAFTSQHLNEDKVAKIVDYLLSNASVMFKSQQRNEDDLTTEEKRAITIDLLNKNKFSFLTRFGQYLQDVHLNYFKEFVDDTNDGTELGILINTLLKSNSSDRRSKNVKNRRYNALEKLIEDKKYFSETEMMKRNPLLYDQLVGQYLSEKERKERDKAKSSDSFVKILMESIERDEVRETQEKQQENEDNAMEEEEEDDSPDDDESDDEDYATSEPSTSSGTQKPKRTLWGEIPDHKETIINKANFKNKSFKGKFITEKERDLLKHEFIAIMHESFLSGHDANFDYNAVDNSEEFDDLDTVNHDAEDEYFDSEEPADVEMMSEAVCKEATAESSSEDELDIYMNALNQHPTVIALSDNLKKM